MERIGATPSQSINICVTVRRENKQEITSIDKNECTSQECLIRNRARLVAIRLALVLHNVVCCLCPVDRPRFYKLLSKGLK